MSLSIKEQRKLNKEKEQALERLLTKVRHHVLTDGLIKEFLSIDDLPVGSIEKLATCMSHCYEMSKKYAIRKIKELQASVNREKERKEREEKKRIKQLMKEKASKTPNKERRLAKLESDLFKARRAFHYFRESVDAQEEKINRINDEILSIENDE